MAANKQDLDGATIDPRFVDRLRLTPERIQDMADGLQQVAQLKDRRRRLTVVG